MYKSDRLATAAAFLIVAVIVRRDSLVSSVNCTYCHESGISLTLDEIPACIHDRANFWGQW